MKKYDTQRTVSASNLIFSQQQQQNQNSNQQGNGNKLGLYNQLESKGNASAESASLQSYAIGNLMNPLNYSRQIQSANNTNHVLKLNNAPNQMQEIQNQQQQQSSSMQVKKQNFILKNNLRGKNATFCNGQSNNIYTAPTNTTIINNTQNSNYYPNLSPNYDSTNQYRKYNNDSSVKSNQEYIAKQNHVIKQNQNNFGNYNNDDNNNNSKLNNDRNRNQSNDYNAKQNNNNNNNNTNNNNNNNKNNQKNEVDTFSSDVSGGFSSESDEGNNKDEGASQQQLINSIYDYYQYNHPQTAEQPKRHYLEDLPPQPIIEKPYSLQPDMIFGWVPKIHFNGPIPLNFKNNTIDRIIRELGVSTSMYYNQYKLCYIGFRPYTSLELHQEYSGTHSYAFRYDHLFTNDYPHLTPFFDQFSKKYREPVKQPFLGNNPLYSERKDILKFDSTFESGNLDIAVKIENTEEYDLFMRVDSNTKGHFQWFYFKVSGAQKGQKVKFNICNFYKKKSLYSRGMKPYILSERGQRDYKRDWAQEGNNVSYNKQNYRYNFVYDEDDTRKQPFCLSFDYEFQYENDTVWFSFCVPYTFTKLVKFLKETMKAHHSQNKDFITEEKLCQTMSGIDVPLLTVTDNVDMSIPYKNRKVVLISGRIHPGESNGSWMMHGLLQFLFGESEEAKKVRRNTIFKIIPMLNPDGVIMGNYRTGLAGRDLNRVFHSGDKILYPTIVSMKELTLELKRTYDRNFNIFIDLHGHSVKKNVFAYGPEFPIYDLNYYKCRILPKLMGEQIDMFRYYSSIFKISPGKKNTGRAILFNQFDIQLSYTIEASNGSFYRNGFSKPFNADYLIEMGLVIGKSLQKYILSTIDYEATQSKKMLLMQKPSGALQNIEIIALPSDDEQNIVKEQTVQQKKHEFLVDDKVADEQKEELKENLKKIKRKEKKIDKKKKRNKKQDDKTNNLNSDQINDLPFSNLFKLDGNDQNGKHESDNYSEGGSDSESSDEDYDKGHLKMMQKNIGINREMFKTIFQNTNYIQGMKKQNQQQLLPQQSSKRNSNKGRSLLTTSKDTNKNLSDSAQKIRNVSTSTEARDQKIPEKKGIYVSKTIHIRPLTANQGKKNMNVGKIDEEQVDEIQLKEYNTNRPQTVGQKKIKADSKNNQNSKTKLLSNGGKEQVNIINYQQTLSKNAQKPPINGKQQQASKSWLIMMKSVQEYEQEKKQKIDQAHQLSISKDSFYQELKEKPQFSNYQAEINNPSQRMQKPTELQQLVPRQKDKNIQQQQQQDDLEQRNLNQMLIHTPNSLIDQQEQYFRKSKQDGFKPKQNCPSAFYAMKKHFNLKKKEEEDKKPQSTSVVQDKISQRIPLLGNNKVYQNYQAKIYGAVAQRESFISSNNNFIYNNNYQNNNNNYQNSNNNNNYQNNNNQR